MAKKRTPPKKSTAPVAAGLTFESLVRSISGVDQELAAQASRAVNVGLTLRNWLIGCYISEYELHGADHAQYGERLLAKLSARLTEYGVSRTEERELRRYRQFYQVYPQIRESLSPELRQRLGSPAINLPGPNRGSRSRNRTFRHGAHHPAVVHTYRRDAGDR